MTDKEIIDGVLKDIICDDFFTEKRLRELMKRALEIKGKMINSNKGDKYEQ